MKNEIIAKFQQRTTKYHPFVIGIDGLSGAGKTTLVSKLESELKYTCRVVVIHMDDLIVERNKRYHTGFEEWYEYYYLQWDINELTVRLFNSLRTNHKITFPFYEKSIDKTVDKTNFHNTR